MGEVVNFRKKLVDFWPLFIGTHLHPWNRRFHVAGNLLMATCLLTAGGTGRWIFLPLAFLGYLPSWLGHFCFEGNLPVTLKSPLVSGLCDLKMMGLMLAGELDPELLRLFGSVAPRPGTQMQLSLDQERAFQKSLRFRIRREIEDHPFQDYWDIFLLKHQNKWNVGWHVAAMLLLYAIIGVAFLTAHWQWLLLIPLSQLIGLFSHAMLERTHIDFEDAIFSRRAFWCLNKMMILTLTGRYGRDLRQVQEQLAIYLLNGGKER